ncbi:hypothetical protein C5F59_004650 [Streptomyces sp. QL37]|uniref:hypothetical protein n=1 Tax=Streptomyces sp. QL37 TaxID=2093747 RepID=UPI000CF2D0FF|nr:hypothetical protein [Streptomyces sp. QL37]PPQ56073.1 hypothetical protein C5F59_04690 [Streptomyces sp. QL37]
MRITAHGPAAGATALVTVLLAAVTGCSSSGPSDGDDGSKLLTALGSLADDSGKKQVTFVDGARVRELSKDDEKRFTSVSQPASPLLSPYQSGLLGQRFRVTQIDTAVDTGEAGHWTGTFDGAAITKALKSDGYTQSEKDGRKIWARTGDTGASLQVSDDEISYSTRDDDTMAAVDPKEGSSLADDKEFRRAAECLGDVYRADFNPLSSPNPVRLAALGQQASSAAKNTEVLCFVVKDDAAARSLESDLQAVVSAESPKFDGTKVTVEKGDQPVVRAVVPDSATQRPGRLILSDVDLWMAAAQ